MPNDNESCKKIAAITAVSSVATALIAFGVYTIASNNALSCPEGNSNSTNLTDKSCRESLLWNYCLGGLIISNSVFALSLYIRSRMESRVPTATTVIEDQISFEMPRQNSSDLNRSTSHQNATEPSARSVANSAQLVSTNTRQNQAQI